jgi:hypothetical protein
VLESGQQHATNTLRPVPYSRLYEIRGLETAKASRGDPRPCLWGEHWARQESEPRARPPPRIAPGLRLWAVPYTRLTPGQIPLSTQDLIMRRLEPTSIHADATMAEVSAALTGTARPVFTHAVGLARTWFHAHACDRPHAPMKKGRARSCDRVRAPWPISGLLLTSEIDRIDLALKFEACCIMSRPYGSKYLRRPLQMSGSLSAAPCPMLGKTTRTSPR